MHTNAPHHREAAQKILGANADKASAAQVISTWEANDLEEAIVDAGGCAAEMRSITQWRRHEQGVAVMREPLINWCEVGNADETISAKGGPPSVTNEKPLAGLRVLDLTRVLAGPVATRFLARFGANVLRIDPLDWDEGVVIPEVTVGKRCAGLNLKSEEGRNSLRQSLRDADILVHGYRPGALAGLGFDSDTLRKINPRLIDVSLCAYGWTGPWRDRRGFDSLVQMSCGIAHEGMIRAGASNPTPLPAQALDQATGYLMAAAALRALRIRRGGGPILAARLSLARTAMLLIESLSNEKTPLLAPETTEDLESAIENTFWGPARRVRFPVQIGGFAGAFPHPAGPLRTSPARWE